MNDHPGRNVQSLTPTAALSRWLVGERWWEVENGVLWTLARASIAVRRGTAQRRWQKRACMIMKRNGNDGYGFQRLAVM